MIATKQKNDKTVVNDRARALRKKDGFSREFSKYKWVYFMALPGIIYYLVFCYAPMFGVLIGFQDFKYASGITNSDWVGLKHIFKFIFQSKGTAINYSVINPDFVRTVGNTVVISFMNLIIGFPAPIILALLLNEIKSSGYKRVVQTITYIPHFISTVIICGMISRFSMKAGLFNAVLGWFGFPAENLLLKPEAFKWIYVLSDLWQQIGWNSIIYLAALSGIDPTLYEAASIDGAGKFRQVFTVTLPAIIPTIVTLFIMRLGSMISVGSDKVLLLYNDMTMETADVISTYVYRKSFYEGTNYSYSTAIGLFNSLVNICFLTAGNAISRKVAETSLW
ncbi:MAG: sugar ABC transporter permease [Clostridia bacterium]|nr:sugar ABC transporter permease [Clostridia bacterium]